MTFHSPTMFPAALLIASLAVSYPAFAQTEADGSPAPAQSAPSATVAADPPAPAPGAASAPAVRLADGRFLLDFHNASLDAVLTFFAETGGLVVINDVRVEGRINVLSRQPLTLDEAMGVLNSVLKDKGYAAVRMGKTLRIIALDAAKKATIPVRTGNDPQDIAQTDEIITQVVPVRFADARQLKTDLAPLIPSFADISANASTNTLIITDASANIRRIVEIIRALDTSVSAVTKVQVFTLKYANATNAARLLTSVFAQDQASGGNQQRQGFPTGGFQRFFAGGPGGGQGQGNAGSDSGPGKPQTKVVASADDRTNTVVVSAPVDVMPIITQVLKDLDANPAQDQAVFTYYLRNAQAANVQNVINSLFGASTGRAGGTTGNNAARSSQTSTTGSNTRRSAAGNSGLSLGTFGANPASTRGTTAANTGGSAMAGRLSPAASQTAADLAGQVYAVADADTNSVLVMTGSGNFPRVKSLLEELDRPVPQVLIKVLLAEVSHDNTTDLGVEFSAINLPASGKTTIFSNFGNAAATIATGANPGGLAFKLVEADVTAAITALQKVGKIDVLSRPYILASDNQLASIMVGQNVPFVTNSRTDSNGGIINTIQYQDIGIILNVTPHINPDGVVVMDVAPEISALSGDTVQVQAGVNAPVFNKRSAQTKVSIRDGQTIVIGGLMQDQKTQTVNKVPLLGDIPLLGLLFQRDATKTSKTELLIFLTPHVASEPDRLQKMSDDDRQGATITPGAVAPGVFDEHMKGLQRGADVTPPAPAPALSNPPTFPPDAPAPSPGMIVPPAPHVPAPPGTDIPPTESVPADLPMPVEPSPAPAE